MPTSEPERISRLSFCNRKWVGFLQRRASIAKRKLDSVISDRAKAAPGGEKPALGSRVDLGISSGVVNRKPTGFFTQNTVP